MTVDELIELEVQVRDTILELEKEIATSQQHAKPPAKLDGTEGRLSRQDSMQSYEMAKEAVRRQQLRLQQLQAALERMDAGSYGLCSKCNSAIDDERLRLAPESLLCRECIG